MVKPFSRIALNVAPELNQYLEDMAISEKTTKTSILVASIKIMKSIYDAKNKGDKICIITSDNQQKELNII
jgi:hypothetical protein